MSKEAMDCSVFHIPGLPQTANERLCIKINKDMGYDQHGNKIPGATPNDGGGGGNSFLGIPLPSSDWWRHFLFRVGEVVVGTAMVIVGIKALANSGDTTKIIVQNAKKVGSKL